MFVRFRTVGRRLQASLIEPRRVEGKVRPEHIASLGSIAAELSVADRIAFWAGLHQRLARLANRLDEAAQAKVLGEVHARIPMVTVEEIRAHQLANAEADERVWSGLADLQTEQAEGNRKIAAKAERKAAEAKAAAENATAGAESAKERIERLKRRGCGRRVRQAGRCRAGSARGRVDDGRHQAHALGAGDRRAWGRGGVRGAARRNRQTEAGSRDDSAADGAAPSGSAGLGGGANNASLTGEAGHDK